MATPFTWPAELPCFRFEPYSVAPRPGAIEMTLGMLTHRAMVYTQNNEVVDVEVVLTSAQEQAFRTFFKTTLAMGTQWFTAPILRKGSVADYEVMFLGAPPVFSPASDKHVTARFTLLTRGDPLPEPAPFACEVASSGSYLISPAWTSYPTGYTESAPLLIDPFTGRYTFVTNKFQAGAGESPLPPLTLTAVFDTTVYEHIGTLVSSGDTIEVAINAPSSGVWGGAALRKFNLDVTPIQYSQGLFIAMRNGYSGLGFSDWSSTGLATAEDGYLGDFESYSPGAYGGERGDKFDVARAKYLSDAVYVQLGSIPDGVTTTIMRFSAPGGSAPAPTGTSYSGEGLFDDPISRTFSETIQDIASDPATGFLYVMHHDAPPPYTVTIERINPLTLATIESWAGVESFADPVSGFSISGNRAVLAADGTGGAAPNYYVVELNGSGGIDFVHVGVNEIDPGVSLTGAYVFADPLCGFLKQKNRWISGFIGP